MTLNSYFTLNSGYPVCVKQFTRYLLLVVRGGRDLPVYIATRAWVCSVSA